MRLGIDIGGTKTAALVLDDAGDIVAHVAAPSGRGRHAPSRPPSTSRTARWLSAGAGCTSSTWEPACPGSSTPTPGGHATPSTSASPPSTSPGASRRPRVAGPVSTTTSRPRPWEHTTPCGRRSSRARRPTSTSAPGWRPRSSTGAGSSGVRAGGGRDRAPAVGTGIPCSCGQEGCLETIASGSALHRMWPEGPRSCSPPPPRATRSRGGRSRASRTASRSPCRCLSSPGPSSSSSAAGSPATGRAGVGARGRHLRAGGDLAVPAAARPRLAHPGARRGRARGGDRAALLPGTSEPVGAVV